MRQIARQKLASEATTVLAKLQTIVDGSASPKVEAAALWERKTNSAPRKRAFANVRATLKRMSTGLERCMYCEDSAGTDIDHHRPKATHPEKAFSWANYLLACSHCNSNEKREAFPLDPSGQPLLLDPTVDDPYDHFQFVADTGMFVALSERAQKTEDVFGLNRREILEKGRRNTWTSMMALVRGYARARDDAGRARHVDAMRQSAFQAVVQHFFRDALAGRDNIPEDVAAAVKANEAAWSWAL